MDTSGMSRGSKRCSLSRAFTLSKFGWAVSNKNVPKSRIFVSNDMRFFMHFFAKSSCPSLPMDTEPRSDESGINIALVYMLLSRWTQMGVRGGSFLVHFWRPGSPFWLCVPFWRPSRHRSAVKMVAIDFYGDFTSRSTSSVRKSSGRLGDLKILGRKNQVGVRVPQMVSLDWWTIPKT